MRYFIPTKWKIFDIVDDEQIYNPWPFPNWIVYFKFNINIETFKNSDQVWKQNYKLWAPGPSLGSGGKHKKRKGKQSLRILYYFCVNTLVLLLHSMPAIQNCWVLSKNWFTHRPKWQSKVCCLSSTWWHKTLNLLLKYLIRVKRLYIWMKIKDVCFWIMPSVVF